MSGHSKWSTIKRQKEATDKRRGKVFSKLAKVISVAAKSGADPATNFKLRLAIERARQANMPKENISRAIEKASGQGGARSLEEIVYEGYGPAGIAVIIEVVTDNRNRTTAAIKNILDQVGGGLASPGAVAFQFKKLGLITVAKKDNLDEQMLILMDLEVEDVEEITDGIEVYTKPKQLIQIKDKISQAGFQILGSELVMKPTTPIKIKTAVKAAKVLKFVETLENDDDVQKVYTNFV